jgi:putative endopeptidase
MKKAIIYGSLASLGLGIAIIFPSCQGTPDNLPTGISKANFDTTAKPQQDFYEYVNGNWLKNNPIPPSESSWGSFLILRDSTVTRLRNLLQASAAQQGKPGSMEQKLGDYYSTATDSVGMNIAGIKPLMGEFGKIDAISNFNQFWGEDAHLDKLGFNGVFGFGIGPDDKISTKEAVQFGQSGLSLPNKNYYFDTSAKFQQIRMQFVDFAGKMFMQMHENSDMAAKDAQKILSMETEIAKGCMTPIEERDVHATYNKMTYANFIKLAGSVDIKTCTDTFGLHNIDTVLISQPKFFVNLDSVTKANSLDDWKTYLKFHLLLSQAARLGDTIAGINFDFYGKTLNGARKMRPLWKRAVESTSGSMGELLGQLYVKNYFSPEAKEKVNDMVHHIISAYRERLNNAAWMDTATRRAAIAKLDKVTLKLCYPDKWRDYTALEIKRDAWVLNSFRVSEFAFNYNISKYGKPVDKTEWGMSPQTVNAYYNPTANEIVFPAAIMQMPFYDPNRDVAMNYGGMGAVIGHEMTHGFDDQGAEYDADGNMHKWWTQKDSANYHARLTTLINQFDNYIIDSVHVQGKLTIGENTADLGGLTIAYYALQNEMKEHPEPVKDGFTPEQRFFISFAQVWRGNNRPQRIRMQVQNDPHSPNMFRAMGPPSDMKEFYAAFGVKQGDGMYRDSASRAVIW